MQTQSATCHGVNCTNSELIQPTASLDGAAEPQTLITLYLRTLPTRLATVDNKYGQQ